MERFGVNNFSQIPRDSDFYKNLDIKKHEEKEIFNAHPKYYRRGWSATTYYVLSGLLWFKYPYYEHHRKFNFITEAFFGTRNALRKYKHQITEHGHLKKILSQHKKNYYLVPLQTYDDFQIKEHSHFSSIEEFIEMIMHSFSKFAPQGTQLIIKHHPMDRGRVDYTPYINTLAEELAIKDRVISMHDLHLPTCLKNAIGTITINSTVGISSLFHGIPTITLGDAIYDINGLTCKDMPLDDYWTNLTLQMKSYLKTIGDTSLTKHN